MALGDYILCCKCEVKLIYDGARGQRDWWEERWGKEPEIECPDCQAKLRQGVELPETILNGSKGLPLWDEAALQQYGDARDQAGYLRGLEAAKRAVDDAGGDNTDYHMDAIDKLKVKK